MAVGGDWGRIGGAAMAATQGSVRENAAARDSRPALPRGPIALAFATTLVIGASDGATGVLLPSLQRDYGVGKGAISLLFFAMVIGYFISSFASGAIADGFGRRHLLALGAVTFIVGAAGISLHPPFIAVFVAALVIGFGFGTLDVGINVYIAAFPNSTGLLNYLHAFYGGGALLGPLIASGVLAANQPWNRVYLLWAVAGIALFVGFLRLFPASTPAASALDTATAMATTTTPDTERNVLRAAVRLRVVQFGALFLLFYVGVEVTIGSWAYSFLTEVRHGDPLHSGWVTSGYWLGLTLGRLTAAIVASRFAFNNVRLIRYCLAGVFAGVLLVWLVPVSAATIVGLLVIGFSLGPIFPTTISLLPALIPGRLVQSAVGFLAGTGSAGAALFPWLAGVLAQTAGLGSLMPYLVALTGVMTANWFVLRRASATITPQPAG